jgi:antitoxin (DNA-binding transcriptional repressor) of toxin-antitoxin stability system
MNITDAQKDFTNLVDKVFSQGISIDLERDDQVIARLTPARSRPAMTIGEFNAFLRSLPSLEDDADRFADDVREIRSGFPTETNPWD